MQKIVVILMMFFLSLGLTQPSGYMQHFDLHKMYAQCSDEDHDITPLDFIFEHLLNLEAIVNLLEGEHQYQQGDHPHEPSHSTIYLSQAPFALPHAIRFEVNRVKPAYYEAVKYPIREGDFYCKTFCDDILRPPIAA